MNADAANPPLTKIVATVGPTSEEPEVIESMIRAGVSTFRLNFSHGNHERHAKVYGVIRDGAQRLGRPTTILQDLQGPKLRIGDLAGDTPFVVEPGHRMAICTNPVRGTRERVSTSYMNLARDVRIGDAVLIDDGLIELGVVDVRFDTEWGDEVLAEVIHGGLVKPRKGINLPGSNITSPSITAKDLDDLAFGIGLGVDMIALSFVRSPQDVLDARDRIIALGGRQPLIAKIEKPQAVLALEAIVAVSDGLMVARGDLGVEMSPDKVPLIQKRLIRLANKAGKPVITATQMLESMITNPRPTRAESSDIANALLDGTDAVMLSGETAVGAWPTRTVETMARIARTIEADVSWRKAMRVIGDDIERGESGGIAYAIAHAAANLASDLKASAIAVLTATGETAEHVSQHRPGVPILAFADRADVAARLSLWHGVVPVHEELATNTDEVIAQVESGIRRRRYAIAGDRIVIVGSVPRSGNRRALFLECHQLD